MQQGVVRFAGTYRFHHRDALECALTRAREWVNEDQYQIALGGGWMRCFVMFGTTLTVNLAVPAQAEHRVVADFVFAMLRREAIECSLSAVVTGAE